MRAKTRNVKIQFRITEEEYKLLQNRASILGCSEGQTARSILLGGLAGFDEKQATFLYKLDHLFETMELLIDISSMGAAAGALPLDAEKLNADELRQTLKTHFRHSRDLGDNLVEMIKKGKL